MNATPKNILVVEDDTVLNDAYSMILNTAGHTVSNACDGQQALDYLETHDAPDVILLDLRMPVMNGIEFLKHYKEKKPENTRIVVFSNFDSKNEIDEAYSLGADRYILKARATPKELLKLVNTID